MPTSASRTRRSALARFASPFFFFFRGGDFLKLYEAETGLGRASSKEEAVGNYSGVSDIILFLIVRDQRGPSSASASDISARATRA